MDSLANYGSDDDYEENSNDKMGTYKSGQSQSWHQHTTGSATTEADVNYDEVQMDLSEESNNNNSGEDDDSPRPNNNRATDRKRSYRSRSRDDPRAKNHEYRSNRARENKDEDRDRTKKYESKSRYDRDGQSTNYEDRSDRSKNERDGSNSYEDRHERSKYDRDGSNSYEDRHERSKYDRDGSNSHEDRHDRSKYDRDGSNSYEDRHDRSKYERDGSNRDEERSKYGTSHNEDRPERSKYGKDEKSSRSRDDRNRKYRSGSKERRRSGSKERRRSGSRERRRSRSPRRNEYRRRSNSKERDRGSSSRGYGKRFDRTSNKMAQLEKLGIEIKTPDAEFVTPQMLLQRSMDEQVQKVKHSTGIELPKYYNPAAMNPARYADQIQKRRLLWQKKDTTTAAQAPVSQQPATVAAVKVWEQTTFAQDQDGKVASKFKRLMGIKETPATATGPSGGKDILKKQEEMFSSMEQQYEVARTATHTMRGVGLGFGTFQSYPR